MNGWNIRAMVREAVRSEPLRCLLLTLLLLAAVAL